MRPGDWARYVYVMKVLASTTLALLLVAGTALAQELNCRVRIQTLSAQAVDRSVFQSLEQNITQYMNTRRWTNEDYEPGERISCVLNIVITSVPSVERFEGTCQVQAIRPTYGTNYETVVLNFNDPDFNITYNSFQPLEYSEVTFTGNLTALLNTYAMLILGFDHDSFEPGGGIPYFQRALNMVNLASSGGAAERGWRAADGTRNRYWLIENLLNNSYAALHDIQYVYHRKGLDQMAKNAAAARTVVAGCVDQLEKLFRFNPNVYAIRVWLDAKSNELTLLYANATPEQKARFLEVMSIVDPSNMNTYERVQAR